MHYPIEAGRYLRLPCDPYLQQCQQIPNHNRCRLLVHQFHDHCVMARCKLLKSFSLGLYFELVSIEYCRYRYRKASIQYQLKVSTDRHLATKNELYPFS